MLTYMNTIILKLTAFFLAITLSACSVPVGKEQMSTVQGPGSDNLLGDSTADTVEGSPNAKGVGGP